MKKNNVLKCGSVLVGLALLFFFNNSYINNIYALSLKGEASSYREQGYKAQEKGDIATAINWYKKAIALDPAYAAPHNDLGILYEAKGLLDNAEAEYQRALDIDPDYEKAHTNLALLYERKGQLEKAAFHWMRRYKLGKSGDPWTKEAKRRLEKLGLLDKQSKKKLNKSSKPEKPYKKKIAEPKKTESNDGWTRIGSASEKKTPKTSYMKKTKSVGSRQSRAVEDELQESLRLAEERLKEEKGSFSPGSRARRASSTSYKRANAYYKKGEYSSALNTIRTGKRENPEDSSLLALEQKIKNRMKEERIEDHYSEGMIHYHRNNYSEARKEFEAILNILPE